MDEEIQMKMTRYSEPQILAILRQAEGGVPVAELCREHGSKADWNLIRGIKFRPHHGVVLQMAGEVWRDGCIDDRADQGT